MSNEFDFSDLSVREIKNVKVGAKSYTLREASADAACRYRNAIFGSTKLGDNGKPVSMEGIADAEPLLLSFCLVDDETGNQVSVKTVLTWPSRVVEPLVKKLKEISDLGDADPVRDALKAALSREDSPLTLDQFKSFIAKLPEADKVLGPIVRMMRSEETAKNSPSDSTASSA